MQEIKGMGNGQLVFTFLFTAVAGTFMFAIPVFIVVFFFADWATAKSSTLWWSAGVSTIFAFFYTQIDKSAHDMNAKNQFEAKTAMQSASFEEKISFQSGAIYVAINEELTQLLICRPGGKAQILRAADVYDMALEVDEEVISKSSSGMGGSLVGAAVGGVLTGGAGAIVGAVAGNSAKHETKSGIRSISIKMAVNSPDSPLVVLDFLNSGVSHEKSSMVAKHHMKTANTWWALLTVFMRKEAA
ncbi:hypothetical protein [Pseudomonas sp. PLMAX]|uniref:hypothetical protein n=1 Tax=Pseudomonas sp. PLMAX TaxID=2201998 RepID=UPI0038BD3BAD